MCLLCTLCWNAEMADLYEFMAEYSNFTSARYVEKSSTYVTSYLCRLICCWLHQPTHSLQTDSELETLLFVLTQVMSSVVLSDTPCKAKFFLRFSGPVVERSCLPPVDEGFSDDLLKVLGCLVIAEDFLHTFLKHECAMVVFAKENYQDQDCFLHSYFVQYFARRTK